MAQSLDIVTCNDTVTEAREQEIKLDEYWTHYFEGFSAVQFPALSTSRDNACSNTALSISLEGHINNAQLEQVSRELAILPSALAQASWATILCSYLGSNVQDVAFGVLCNGVQAPGASTRQALLPTRVNFSNDVRYMDVLRRFSRHHERFLKSSDAVLPTVPGFGTKRMYDSLLILNLNNSSEVYTTESTLRLAPETAMTVEIREAESGFLKYRAASVLQGLGHAAATCMLKQLDELMQWIWCNPSAGYRDSFQGVPRALKACLESLPREAPITSPSFLHAQFEKHAMLRPNDVAFSFVNKLDRDQLSLADWTYARLNAVASSFAQYLSSRCGDLAGIIVPLLTDKQPELYISILAILKAGGAWCPIDPFSPLDRRRSLIARTESRLLITSRRFTTDLDFAENDDMRVVEVEEALATLSNSNSTSELYLSSCLHLDSRCSTAYLIWTSGTTGDPKGVVMPHRAAVSSMTALQNAIPRAADGETVRCIQFSQQTFDVFIQDLFYTWGLGGTVISAPRELIVASFPRIATFSGATHAHLTPAFAGSISRRSCPTLEVVTMIGEQLPQHVADDWSVDIAAFNTYGPAEAAVVSTLQHFSQDSSHIKSSIVGKPLREVSCYVIRNGMLGLTNGVGELALGGKQLANGYLNDPVKTGARFVWNEELGMKLYLTGDIVRLLPDGIQFIGREDDLIKIQGIRVELSEISFALRGCHDLAGQIETCYLNREDRPAKVLVTFVSMQGMQNEMARSGVIMDESAVNIARAVSEIAKKTLPEFMRPAIVLVVARILRTTSAKTDTRALQRAYENVSIEDWETLIDTGKNSRKERYTYNALESQVLDAVASISGVKHSAIKDSSYLPALGIDSITSHKLLFRLKSLNNSLTIGSILRCRSVNDLLDCVRDTTPESLPYPRTGRLSAFNDRWHPALEEYLATSIERALPATPLQESLLVEALNNSEAYWNHRCYDLPFDIDLHQLRVAFQDISDGTQVLRACFVPIATAEPLEKHNYANDLFLQAILAKHEVQWHLNEDGDDELSHRCRLRARKVAESYSKDISRQPLWAVTILKRCPERPPVMMISIHHVLHDEASLQFLLEDVWNAYSGVTGRSRKQINDVLQLGEFSLESRTDQEDYWKQQLGACLDFSHVRVPDLEGNQVITRLDDSERLASYKMQVPVAKQEFELALRTLNISPPTVFRAAWGHILLLYLDVPNVVFGDVVSQRAYHPDLADAMAPMLSTIPIAFKSFPTVRGLVQDQERATMASRTCPMISAATVRRLIGRPESLPLYPSVFNFLHESEPTKCPWTEIESLIGLHVEHPLALNVQQSSSKAEWTIELFGDPASVSADHLRLMCEQFVALVRAMISRPDASMRTLPDGIDCRILSITSSQLPASVDYEIRTNPVYWVSWHASQHPGWAAVEVASTLVQGQTETKIWDFATLEKEANRIATFLNVSGIRFQTVAMCAQRTLISYAVILGILKSRNIYLPIDESLPKERKRLLLSDSSCALLFTDSACLSAFGHTSSNIQVVNLDSLESTLRSSHALKAGEMALAGPDETAYLLYTSGSTGRPKGVMISRKNLCGFVEGLAEFIGICSPVTHALGGRGKFLGLASRAFDVHLCEMFLGWRLGLRAVTAPREAILDDLQLALTKLKVTHACFVPTLLEQAGIEPQNLPDLAYFSVGGEKMSQKVLDIWGGQEKTLVVNAYGPTELAIGCCASKVTSKVNARNIGKPFGNTIAHVLVPETSNYAVRGQPGELCITGDLVGSGYLDRPDAKGFIPDFHGQKMFRTGDIVRMMADGSLEILGRSDSQTKIRGQRIELGEVSVCIQKLLQGDVDVATLVLQHPSRPKSQLVSFVAPITERRHRYGALPGLLTSPPRSWVEIQAACRDHLPAYMVPDFVIPTSVIPLALTSGKADTKVLQSFFGDLAPHELLQIVTPPINLTQSKRALSADEIDVLDIVRQTLKLDTKEIPYDQNLFDLGLDSLSATKLSLRLRRSGFDSNLRAVLTNPSVEKLARLPRPQDEEFQKFSTNLNGEILGKFEKNARDSLMVDLSRVEAIRPCLHLQEVLVARSTHDRANNLYVNHILFRLQQHVQVSDVEASWRAVASKRPILRTCFYSLRKSFVQLVLKPKSGPLLWNLTSKPSNGTLAFDKMLSELQQESAEDLLERMETVPPLRFSVVKGNTASFVLLSIHHALYDAVSLNHLMNDASDIFYRRQLTPRTMFDDLLTHVSGQAETSQKHFWLDYLSGCTSTLYRPRGTNNDVAQLERNLTISLSRLRSLASTIGVTVSTLSHFCFGVALSRLLHQADVIFGTILSGRNVPVQGAPTIAAPCLTTIPQRVDLRNVGATMQSLAQNFQSKMASSFEFQHTSLRNIQYWLGAEKPIFDSLFQYLGELEEAPRYLDLWTEERSEIAPDYPLAVELAPNTESDTITLYISCKPREHIVDDAEVIFREMETVFMTLLENRDQHIGELGIITNGLPRAQIENQGYDESLYSHQESTMKGVVVEFCGLDAKLVTKSASFFQLGIDSVAAISFSRKLRGAGLEAYSSHIMKHSCIGALCEFIESKPQVEDNVTEPDDHSKTGHSVDVYDGLGAPLNGDTIALSYRCTPLQGGMITASITSQDGCYIHQHAFKLSRAVVVSKFQEAWNKVLEASDVLRTSFHFARDRESFWTAAVRSTISHGRLIHVQAESLEDFIAKGEGGMDLQAEEAFAVPPIKATIVQTATGCFFVLSMHHALYDGISLPYIFTDLAAAYETGELQERPAFHTAAALIGRDQTISEGFWLETLKDYTAMELPRNSVNGPASTIYHERHSDLDLAKVLQEVQALGVTLQTISLLAFGKVLARKLERRDVVFGHVVAGRSLPLENCESIIGPLFNTVPIRIRLESLLKSNRYVAREIQSFTGSAQDHLHAPLQKVQNAWRATSDHPSANLIDVLFLFQKIVNVEFPGKGLWSPVNIDTGVSQAEYGLNFEVEQRLDCIFLRGSCHSTVMSEDDLKATMTQFESILLDITDHPSSSVVAYPAGLSELPLMVHQSAFTSDDKSEEELTIEPAVKAISKIIGDVCRLAPKDISSTASIFALGLDSISAIKVASSCREEGLDLSVADIIQGQTISGIYKRLRHAGGRPSMKGAAVVDRSLDDVDVAWLQTNQVEAVLPCLGGQAYHLARPHRSRLSAAFPIFAFESAQALDPDNLRRAWLELRSSWSILRTVFTKGPDDEASQIVLKSSHMSSSEIEIVPSNSTPIERFARQQVEIWRCQAFSERETLARLVLLKGQDRDGVLLTLHHALYDAWSIQMLLMDLEKLYLQQHLESRPDFVAFARYALRSRRTDDSESYWRRSLHDGQRSLLAPSTPILATTASKSTFLRRSAHLDVSHLYKICRKQHFTVSSLIIVAFARLVARHSNATNPTIGHFHLGRSSSFPGIEDVPGPCLNVLPLVVRDALTIPPAEAARHVQDDLAGRLPYEQDSLADVMRWAQESQEDSNADEAGSAQREKQGSGMKRLFNALINILPPPPASASAPASAGNKSKEEPLFRLLDIDPDVGPDGDAGSSAAVADEDDNNKDDMPSSSTSGGKEPDKKSGVPRLIWPFLPTQALYLDVVLNAADAEESGGGQSGSKGMDLAARAEGGLMDEGELGRWMSEFVDEVEIVGRALGDGDSKVVGEEEKVEGGA